MPIKNCTSVEFSENGYHMATCDGSKVEFWDLRKIGQKLESFHTIKGSAVKIDNAGKYVAVAKGNKLRYNY